MDFIPTWVTSDSHFGHQKIVEYAARPYDHEIMMVKRWAKTVRPTDTILHLGDLFFGGQENFAWMRDEIMPQLPGQKYLILGNHDKRKIDYSALGFTVIKPFSIVYRGFDVTFSHYPKFVEHAKHLHIHGHTHQNGYAQGERDRYGNINVCVEKTEYRPRRTVRLLNRVIANRGRGTGYYNSGSYRQAQARRQRVHR
jgi:calcineurin-like phosphoesterase family protein